jgi:hypothetical protein
MRKAWLTTAIIGTFLLAGCGNSTSNFPHQVTYSLEIWEPYFEKTSDGHCKAANDNYAYNANASLVGPDGAEISSSTFSFGVLFPSDVSKDNISNYPKDDICLFQVIFPDVPDVATYRIKTRDGEIDAVSHPKSNVIGKGFAMYEAIGVIYNQ